MRTLALALAVTASAASAQTMGPVVDLCSDPLTTGAQKRDQLAGLGWAQAALDPVLLDDLAVAHILGFTNGMPDIEERFAAAPRLADNLESMILSGQVSLWAKDSALLALSITLTLDGTEHLSCFFASPPLDETLEIAATYGPPEVLPELELIATRFDETAFAFNPDREYQMYSTWTRLTSDPARGPLTDGYRLERIEQPAN